MAQFSAVIELSGLDGTDGFKINGEVADDIAGYSVSAAGDLNGDGFDDLIIGAYGAEPNGDYSGAAYVVFGAASGFGAVLELSALDGDNGFQLNGAAAAQYTGQAVSSAGDVNGDGFDDVIIGAIGAGPFGTAYIVFGTGAAFGADFELSSIDGNNGFLIGGETSGGFFSRSVSSAGDVNGDGFDDLIVGAYEGDGEAPGTGVAYVVFGREAFSAASIDLADLDGDNGFRINGEATGEAFGHSVSSAGDVNDDGFADLIVSDPSLGAGVSYVIFGKGNFGPQFKLSKLDGANGFQIVGADDGDQAGFSVSGAGDFNADGFTDVLVSSRGTDDVPAGATFVVFGREDGFSKKVRLNQIDGNNGFRIDGELAGDRAGFDASSAGDVNGDGFDDIVIGAPYANANGTYSGACYVVFGTAANLGAAFNLSTLDGENGFKISGEALGYATGRSVSAAGDINGDGFADLIVGATGAAPNGAGSGASYVVFGQLPDEAVNRVGTVASQTLAGGDFDDTLSGLGGADALFGHGGDDVMSGGDGNDTADAGAGDDGIRGGSGNDALHGGDDVDELRGGSGDDALFGDAGSDVLDGGSGVDVLNGGDGNDAMQGSDGDDTLNGGAGDDRMTGGDGTDTLNGGSGVDRFVYETAAESTSSNFDIVKGADFAADVWDVQRNVTGIDPTIASGTLSTAGFDAKLAAAVDAAHLDAHHAVIFTPTSGGLKDKTFLVVDLNGLAGYQAGVDLVVQLNNAENLGNLDRGDFI